MSPVTPLSAQAIHAVSRDDTPANVRAIKPLFVVGGLYSLANGVAWIMKDLAAALGRAGAPVDVCGAECADRGLPSIGHVFEPPTRWIGAPGRWLGGLSWTPRLKPVLREAIAKADVVHNHSIWMLPNSYAARIAQGSDKPVIYTAHGTLEPWALKNSGWKKRLVGAWFQMADLKRADCIHVNSHAEIDGIRRLGIRCPIAVIPNGVNLDEFDLAQDVEPFFERFPALRGKRLMLFMARLHVKKGLGHLIPAWGNLATAFPDWHLVIAGPDGGFQTAAQQLVTEQRIGERVTFTGPLVGEVKRAARAACELFVQPSFSEGFSMAILEALATAKPVLMTPGCNFREAAAAGAAIEVEPSVEGVTEGYEGLLSQDRRSLEAMGLCGRKLVEQRYDWNTVATKMLDLYRWLGDQGERPAAVLT